MRQMWKAGRTDPCGASEAGYTYVSLLVVLVAAALAAQTTFMPSASELRREAEAELIFQGLAYRAAIKSYLAADPENPTFPARLEDLLDDPRAGGTRHLRRLYAAPLGGAWRPVPAAGGGIAGVVPELAGTPMKQTGFPPELGIDNGVTSYSDWVFAAEPPVSAGTPNIGQP